MAKRKYGEGSIRQRKDGRWEGRIVIAYDERGFPKAKSVLAKSKWECQQKLEKLKQELKAPIEKLTDNISFGDCMDFWFREFATPRLKESTKETYGYCIYTPTVAGKRTAYKIYAPTEAECEEKLAELIKSIREGREQNIG